MTAFSVEWTVVTVLISLVGLVGLLARPMIALNTAITKLTQSVVQLEKSLHELGIKNEDAHDKLNVKSRLNSDKLGDHETRIRILEQK